MTLGAPSPLRLLIVGCGNMGSSHTRAYLKMPDVEIVGLVSRGDSKGRLVAELGIDVPLYNSIEAALEQVRADAACISTYPDTHEELAIAALRAGCHVFLEKPIATSVAGARRVLAAARVADRRLVIGYILRHHPSWKRFVEVGRALGRPLVMRMNLNQQSSAGAWQVHRNLLQSTSPLVDCGVHYVDVMCQMTSARPMRVSAIGARLAEGLPPGRCNYGQLQVTFDDGSVGWYEAGWGPMMSETAYFVKDVIGPKGSASIMGASKEGEGRSAVIEDHVLTHAIRLHHAELDEEDCLAKEDTWLLQDNEPDHDELCLIQQRFFADAIRTKLDLSAHLRHSLASLEIVLAAEESIRTGETIHLGSVDAIARAARYHPLAPAAKWFVGIDGGATNTRVVIADQNGEVRGRTHLPEGCSLALGTEIAWTRIREALESAFDAMGEVLDPDQMALGIGIAGANNESWCKDFVARASRYASLRVDTDGFASLLGAHGGQPGVVVAVGTGSVGEVLEADGSRRQVGGYGFPAGDQSGGAWIGQQLSLHLQHAVDGTVEFDELAEALSRKIGATDRESTIVWLSTADANQFAQLVPVGLAHREHSHVRFVLENAARDIASMLEALTVDRNLPVALIGGLAPTLRPLLSREWQSRLVECRAEAVDGALMLTTDAWLPEAVLHGQEKEIINE